MQNKFEIANNILLCVSALNLYTHTTHSLHENKNKEKEGKEYVG